MVAVEELFSLAALLGCFVVPIAIAARSVGTRLAGEMDQSHETVIRQHQP